MKITALLILAAILTGCEKRYESELKTETATVLQLAYVPATDGSTSGGVGISPSDGKMVYVCGESIHTDEVWSVVFRCDEHKQTFALTGKDLYSRASVGANCVLEYVDIYAIDDTGNKKIIEHHTKRVIFK